MALGTAILASGPVRTPEPLRPPGGARSLSLGFERELVVWKCVACQPLESSRGDVHKGRLPPGSPPSQSESVLALPAWAALVLACHLVSGLVAGQRSWPSRPPASSPPPALHTRWTLAP